MRISHTRQVKPDFKRHFCRHGPLPGPMEVAAQLPKCSGRGAKNARTEKMAPVGFKPTASRSAAGRSTNWAKWPLVPRCRSALRGRKILKSWLQYVPCSPFRISLQLSSLPLEGPPGRDGEAVRQSRQVNIKLSIRKTLHG